MHWRTRRKLYYTTAALLPLVIIAGIIYYSVFFSSPTCSDGRQNGSETGIDCGGSCQQICQENTASSTVKWAQAFRISGDIHNLSAYIQNPNVSLEAQSVPYRFRVYDQNDLLIAERRGSMDIPPQPATLAFEGGVDTEGRTVARTEFDWLETPFWRKSNVTEASFPVSNKTLSRPTSSTPRLTFDVTNPSVRTYQDLQLAAVVRDGAGRPVQVSQTEIGALPAQSTKPGVFTWRRPFPTRTGQCQVPSDIMLLIDRSGSRDGQSQDQPAQAAVKSAASDFVRLLGESARSGLVSFAGRSEVSQSLSRDHADTLQAVESLSFSSEDDRGTVDTGSAVRSALSALSSTRDSRHTDVMILLTDGKVNTSQASRKEASARQQITRAKDSGVVVYTIGLGEDAGQAFLRRAATSPSHHFQAASRQALSAAYQNIHDDLCEPTSFITEIIPTNYELSN